MNKKVKVITIISALIVTLIVIISTGIMIYIASDDNDDIKNGIEDYTKNVTEDNTQNDIEDGTEDDTTNDIEDGTEEDIKKAVEIVFEVADEEFSTEDFEETINVIKERARALNAESSVYVEGKERITVTVPDVDDVELVADVLGKKGELEFITSYGDSDERVWLDNSHIAEAQPITTRNESTGTLEYLVSLKFTDDGAEIFEEVTGSFVGKTIYIVYDGEIISSPVVSTKISGGEATISGMESYDEAEELAAMIRMGSLKLELKEISSEATDK